MAKKKRAKSNGVNVSEVIRQTWDADQSLKPKAIVEALKGRGIEVKAGTVATTLSQYRKKQGMPALRGNRKGKRGGKAESFRVGNGLASGPRVGNGLTEGPRVGNNLVANVMEAINLITKARGLVGAEGVMQIVKGL